LFLREIASRPRVSLPPEPPKSITLVVPCYGHATYLPEMLQSIISQTRLPDEVVFVDDYSPDATGELLREFIAADAGPGGRSRLIVNDRNLGQSASLNLAISVASSELIMILNDDDYLMHDAVESMMNLFGQHRDVALIGANHVSFAGREALAAAPKLSSAHSTSGPGFTVHRSNKVPGFRHADDLSMTHSGLCFLKMAWEAVGGYRSDKQERVVFSSDRDFQIRVNAIWPVAVALDIPLAFWRNDSSVDGSRHS
jgi:glycosyltransferase involved in cell wall biosynthesis